MQNLMTNQDKLTERLEELEAEREALVYDLLEATNSTYAKSSLEEAEQALAAFDDSESGGKELAALQFMQKHFQVVHIA